MEILVPKYEIKVRLKYETYNSITMLLKRKLLGSSSLNQLENMQGCL